MRTNALGISSSIIKPELYLRDGEQRKEENKESGGCETGENGPRPKESGNPLCRIPHRLPSSSYRTF